MRRHSCRVPVIAKEKSTAQGRPWASSLIDFQLLISMVQWRTVRALAGTYLAKCLSELIPDSSRACLPVPDNPINHYCL